MMKNITLSADDAVIQQARRRATLEHTTLNELFRTWLEHYVAQPSAAQSYDDLMAQLDHINATRKFSREEMNERQ